MEQLRLRLPVVHVTRAEARRPEDRSARALRLAAAPPLRQRGVRPQPRADARREREPRVRRGLPGVPRRLLARDRCAVARWVAELRADESAVSSALRAEDLFP